MHFIFLSENKTIPPKEKNVMVPGADKELMEFEKENNVPAQFD